MLGGQVQPDVTDLIAAVHRTTAAGVDVTIDFSHTMVLTPRPSESAPPSP